MRRLQSFETASQVFASKQQQHPVALPWVSRPPQTQCLGRRSTRPISSKRQQSTSSILRIAIEGFNPSYNAQGQKLEHRVSIQVIRCRIHPIRRRKAAMVLFTATILGHRDRTRAGHTIRSRTFSRTMFGRDENESFCIHQAHSILETWVDLLLILWDSTSSLLHSFITPA